VAQARVQVFHTRCRRSAAGMAEQFAAGLAHGHAALLVLAAQLLQQRFLGIHADGTAEVGDGGHFGVALQHVQELQRTLQPDRRPGGPVDHGIGVAAGVDAGKDLVHGRLLAQCISCSTAPGLSCTAKRSTMVALASFSPMTSTWPLRA
jgi:hypothetical protein